ncbi:sigma-70 family RNA polymerase sigma factor [Staphylococcus americanisciuri]|uniref:Sigma-70 family RNA polymerase sigma factor n=1 Tax=Staphylococcus americanisciuri TaxID=2973940 RepID=A0ABT2F2D3_9STAP|nr:sigma-70 family RNA polymerase sigma factor [Staphylococcus americanisciuri]MCS4486601.1 sigma-70 family RNA polymerase sigma factor [Staphylococcus americanisciuri]
MSQKHPYLRPHSHPHAAIEPSLMEQQLNYIQQRAMQCFNDYSVHKDEREDLVQETMFALYNKLRTGDVHSDVPIEHYINKTIRCRKLDYRRKKMIRKRIFQTYVQSLFRQTQYDHQVHGNTIDLALRNDMLLEVYNEVFLSMTPMEQQVCCYLYQEWKPAEIARAMAVDIKKVYNTIYRVRQKLKAALQANVD